MTLWQAARYLTWGALSLALGACATRPELVLPYKALLASEEARIFLIAGAQDSAGFAREIIEQKNIWMERGVPENHITCFYARPETSSFNAQRPDFERMANDLSYCYPANLKVIREHLDVARENDPPFVYLYFTSHGMKPLSQSLKEELRAKAQKEDYGALMTKFPFLDHYRLVLESLSSGETINQQDTLKAYSEGVREEDMILTPRQLGDLLRKWPKRTPKFVVLQGCYSGGFIEASHGKWKKELITSIPNLTVITASSASRTSFGCRVGRRDTYFGRAFNETLAHYHPGLPPKMNWKQFYSDVKTNVSNQELQLGLSAASYPLFYSSKLNRILRGSEP